MELFGGSVAIGRDGWLRFRDCGEFASWRELGKKKAARKTTSRRSPLGLGVTADRSKAQPNKRQTSMVFYRAGQVDFLNARLEGRHEMIQGIDSPPPIHGYVLTTLKDNPLVEVSMRADQPGSFQSMPRSESSASSANRLARPGKMSTARRPLQRSPCSGWHWFAVITLNPRKSVRRRSSKSKRHPRASVHCGRRRRCIPPY